MKVTVNSQNDFCESLASDWESVAQREIWVRIDRGEAEDGSEAVQVSLTAVIARDDFAHILEFQQIVGYDRELGPDATSEGTEAADAVVALVKYHCDKYGLKTRKGRVEF